MKDLLPLTSLSGKSIRAGESLKLNIRPSMEEVQRQRSGFHGTIREGGKPAFEVFDDIHIQLSWREWNEYDYYAREVDPRGPFTIGGLPPGEYGLSLWGHFKDKGSFVIERRLSLLKNRYTEVAIDEGARVRVAGRVRAGGSFAEGLTVQAWDPRRKVGSNKPWLHEFPLSYPSSKTDSGGNYRLGLYGGRSYFLLIQSEGKGSTQVEVPVPGGKEEFNFDIDLPSGRCAGTVVHKGTAVPVPEARVEVFRTEGGFRSYLEQSKARKGLVACDPWGRFKLMHLPPGTYTLRAEAEGFAETRIEGLRIEGENPSAEVRVDMERGFSIWVKPVDRKGLPIIGSVETILRDRSGKLIQDPGSLRLARPGDYRLTMIHPDFAPARIELEAAKDSAETTAVLLEGGKLRIHAIDPRGEPVEGAEAEVLDERGMDIANDLVPDPDPGMPSPYLWFFTDIYGEIVLEHLTPGLYRVSVRKRDRRSEEVRVSILEGRTAEARLALPE